MSTLSEEDTSVAVDQARNVSMVLEAIDRLLDAMETLEAPITRELLRTAMTALVHECKLQDPGIHLTH